MAENSSNLSNLSIIDEPEAVSFKSINEAERRIKDYRLSRTLLDVIRRNPIADIFTSSISIEGRKVILRTKGDIEVLHQKIELLIQTENLNYLKNYFIIEKPNFARQLPSVGPSPQQNHRLESGTGQPLFVAEGDWTKTAKNILEGSNAYMFTMGKRVVGKTSRKHFAFTSSHGIIKKGVITLQAENNKIVMKGEVVHHVNKVINGTYTSIDAALVLIPKEFAERKMTVSYRRPQTVNSPEDFEDLYGSLFVDPKICKEGAATGYSEGSVQEINFAFHTDRKFFGNFITIKLTTDIGDSGSDIIAKYKGDYVSLGMFIGGFKTLPFNMVTPWNEVKITFENMLGEQLIEDVVLDCSNLRIGETSITVAPEGPLPDFMPSQNGCASIEDPGPVGKEEKSS